MKKFRNKLVLILSIGLFFLIILLIANLVSFAVLRLFGLQYDSIKELLKFAVLVNLMIIPIDLALNLVPEVLQDMGKIKDKNNVFVYGISGISSTLILAGVQHYMDSVSIPIYTIVFFSMGVSLVEMILMQKKVL